jgi:hypothetical protein
VDRREIPKEVRREVDRSEEERLRGASEAAGGSSERHAEGTRELEAAGWERRGDGPKAIWRRPEGDRWYAHYQVLEILRKERLDARVGPAAPGEDA